MGYSDYSTYGYAADTTSSALGVLSVVMGVMFLFLGVIMVFSIVCQWKLFKKAGKNGWEAIVPIYNMIVLFEISKTPIWMIILFFIPIGNIIVMFMLYINLAKQFGKDTGFGIGMAFLPIIFLPMLAFGKSQYVGSDLNIDNSNNDMNFANMNNNANNNIDNNFQTMNQSMNFNNVDNNPINNNPINNDLGFAPQMDNNLPNNAEVLNNQFNNGLNNVVNSNVFEDTVVIPPVNITHINDGLNQNASNNVIADNNISNDLNFGINNENQPVDQPININNPVDNSNNEIIQENNSIPSDAANIGFSDLTSKIENVNSVSNNSESVCPNCGNKYNAGDMFCINCGTKLN